jgi:hypothetical protein
MTLAEAQTIFTEPFLKQINYILINGNYGDLVMNPESADIIEYFFKTNNRLHIQVSTNGSGQSREFWRRLGKLNSQGYNLEIFFCLDGLADTHHLYRQNTSWDRIILNAGEYIREGGRAIWKMIEFEHNIHQFKEARALAAQLGFIRLESVNDGRNTGPVLNTQGVTVHTLSRSSDPINTHLPMEEFIQEQGPQLRRREERIFIEDSAKYRGQDITREPPRCATIKNRQIYITSTGDVYPCCYIGYHPRTFGTTLMPLRNQQLRELMGEAEISALRQPISECLAWFNRVEESWSKKTFQAGRLWVCESHCGAADVRRTLHQRVT